MTRHTEAMPAPRLVVAGIVVDAEGLVLAARRSYPASLAGQWEFPGGKVEPGEDPRAGLARELAEELHLVVDVGEELPGPVSGCWPINDQLVMRAFWCTSPGIPQAGHSHDRVDRLTAGQLETLAWLPADVALARTVADCLAGRAG